MQEKSEKSKETKSETKSDADTKTREGSEDRKPAEENGQVQNAAQITEEQGIEKRRRKSRNAPSRDLRRDVGDGERDRGLFGLYAGMIRRGEEGAVWNGGGGSSGFALYRIPELN